MSVSSGLPLVRIALRFAWIISPRSSCAVNDEARASGAARRTSSLRSCTGTAHPRFMDLSLFLGGGCDPKTGTWGCQFCCFASAPPRVRCAVNLRACACAWLYCEVQERAREPKSQTENARRRVKLKTRVQ